MAEIRDECVAPALTDKCTDEEPCFECGVEKDIENNPELYQALADE